jgi:hypothetical protein
LKCFSFCLYEQFLLVQIRAGAVHGLFCWTENGPKPPSKANEKKFSLSTPFGTEIRQRLNGRKNKTKQKKKKND